MKKNCFYTVLIALLFIMQGCKLMYRPNMQNVPLFKEKNELKATLSSSNAQAAYSVTNNIGVMLNGHFTDSKWSSSGEVSDPIENNDYSSNSLFVEGGVGYFMPISKNGVFEVYGGAGAGNVDYNQKYKNTNGSGEYDFSANSMRFFVQPNIGYSNEVVDVAFSSRFAALKFYDIKNSFIQDLQDDNNISDIGKPLYMFIEPAVTVRFGWKYVKFHTQLMMSFKTNAENLNYLPISFNAGIHLNIAPRYKK